MQQGNCDQSWNNKTPRNSWMQLGRCNTMRQTNMKNIRAVMCALPLMFAVSMPASAQQVSVSVGGELKPGVYGRIDIGTSPPPPVLYAKPVVITRPVVVPVRPVAPVYMHVPPGHAKKWSKHCHKYNACGTPVYFAKGPEYSGHPGKGKGKGRGRDKDD
jgi:hypothetical protein